jgi:hypothetical protein
MVEEEEEEEEGKKMLMFQGVRVAVYVSFWMLDVWMFGRSSGSRYSEGRKERPAGLRRCVPR